MSIWMEGFEPAIYIDTVQTTIKFMLGIPLFFFSIILLIRKSRLAAMGLFFTYAVASAACVILEGLFPPDHTAVISGVVSDMLILALLILLCYLSFRAAVALNRRADVAAVFD